MVSTENISHDPISHLDLNDLANVPLAPSTASSAANATDSLSVAEHATDSIPAGDTMKPELVVDPANLPATAQALRDLFVTSGRFFNRGLPVEIVPPEDGSSLDRAKRLTKDSVVRATHQLCQPVRLGAGGRRDPITLPDRVALMYLGMDGNWSLPPLTGVRASPLLSADGGVRVAKGYDPATGLWCCGLPSLDLPSAPSQADAAVALMRLRRAFRTFPFADAPRRHDDELGVEVIDIDRPPGDDETAFLVALSTAACRSSLDLAPGLLLTAPAYSGAGCGKGLLVRAICAIAFGIRPDAVTYGGDQREFEKRLSAELIEAKPAVFFDNFNEITLRSGLLASVMTERPARIRLLQLSHMVTLYNEVFVAITGNSLSVAEDLARRFITCELDAQCEAPENRSFLPDFLGGIERRRSELLGAVLTIWRFGRQNASILQRGSPLGSFERWTEWCRDPFVTLGCPDPVKRIETFKARDPHRRHIVELFQVWWKHHGSAAVTVDELAQPVKLAANPHGRSRQYLARYIQGFAKTRANGFVLTRQEGASKWNAAMYALIPIP